MKNFIILSLVICIGWCSSCVSAHIAEARKTAQDFFESLVNSDNEKMLMLYPDKDKLGNWFKSDSFSILSEKQLPNHQISIVVMSFKSIGTKKVLDREIELFLEKKDNSGVEDTYIIVDSKGVISPTNKEWIQFAIKTGCLEENYTNTDQIISNGLRKADHVYHIIDLQMAQKVLNQVTITDFKWGFDANGALVGRGIVTNNSEFELEKVKYVIKLKDSDGKTYMEKSDYVPAFTIQPGTQKAFSFYFTETGKPASTAIRLKFDSDWIRNQIFNSALTGNECEAYVD